MLVIYKNIILILYLLNIIILTTNFSASYIKVGFFVFITFIGIIYATKNSWTIRVFRSTGLQFYFYFIIALSLGYFYGYASDYVLINIAMVLPILSILFINVELIEYERIINTIKYVSLITAVFSIILFFFWEQIDFISNLVFNKKDEVHFLSRFYSDNTLDERNVRSTGFFKDAYENGLIILSGFTIYFKNMLQFKTNKIRGFIILFIYVLAIYTTQTRNIYFLAFAILVFSILLDKVDSYKIFFLLLILAFVTTISISVFFAINYHLEYGSLYARYFSWIRIIEDYFLQSDMTNILFGHALTQFENESSPFVTYWYVDNIFFSVYLGSGLIGIILFISWIYYANKILFKRYKQLIDLQSKTYIWYTMMFLIMYFLGGAMNVNVLALFFIYPFLILIKKVIVDQKQSINFLNYT